MAGKFQNWFYQNIWDTRSLNTIGGAFWQAFVSGEDNTTQERVTELIASKIAAVYISMNVRSQTISALPINVFQENNGKKTVLTDHPVYYPLAHQPNEYMSSANLFLTSMLHSDGWGNSFVYINRDFRGRPVSFELLCPWEVSITKSEGRAWYGYDGQMIPSRDMLHFRWFSWDGLEGISPIRQNASTIGMAIKQDRFSAMAIGSKPPGVLSYEGDLKPEQRAENQKNWTSDIALGKTPVLSGRWKFDQIMINPQDAQYIESRKMTKNDIYGIFRIPPTFAQDFERATFSNAEQQDLVFVKHTITPIIRIIEQECNMKLFTEKEKRNTYIKFNLNGLLRGDLAARKEFYQSMVNTGIMNRNEARSLEDLNGYAGGDDFLVQGAMVPADMLRKKYETDLLATAPSVPAGRKNGYHKEEFYN